MLYLYEIAERTPEQHFEGNHYVTASQTKMNATRINVIITL
jgi:hypothetical protein